MRIFLLLFIPCFALGAPPKLVKDINKNFPGQSSMISIKSGSNTFFVRRTASFGAELWVHDGVSTRLVKDIEPGSGSSLPNSFKIATGGKIYFYAKTTTYGNELWISDGTEVGTKMLKDIKPGPASAIQDASLGQKTSFVIPGSDTILFAADDGINGNELWVSDGTTSGTVLFGNLSPVALSSNPRDFYLAGSIIMFSAETLAGGREPWMILFGSAGQVSDVSPGGTSSTPYGFSLNPDFSKVLFSAEDTSHGRELWQTNIGTTTRVKDIVPGPRGGFFGYMTTLPSGVVFTHVALLSDGPSASVMKSDGTESGTSTVKNLDCLPGGLIGFGFPEALYTKKLNDKIIFPCLSLEFSDSKLNEFWVTDGTEAGTKMLKDIFPGERGSTYIGGFGGTNRIMFPANDGSRGMELWSSDGNTAVRLADFNPGEASAFDGEIFSQLLSLSNPESEASVIPLRKGRRIFGVLSDGVTLSEIFDDSYESQTVSSNPADFISLGRSIVFSATDPKLGREPFISNGTRKGTKIVRNIFRSGDSNPRNFVKVAGDRFVFVADSPRFGEELWISDGTKKGTRKIREIGPGLKSGARNVLGIYKKRLYFSGDDAVTGNELWSSDLTKRGTKRVFDIFPGDSSSDPYDFTVFKGRAYFSARNSTSGREVWRTNGRTTELFADVREGEFSSSPDNFTVVGDKLFFVATDGVSDRELWVTDGNTTQLVRDIFVGATGSEPSNLVASGGLLYFVASDLAHGRELWVSDGTFAGTRLVSDIYAGPTSSSIDFMVPFGSGRVIFGARNAANGSELWIADSSGATLLKDISPGTSSSTPQDLFKIPKKNLVYFSASMAGVGRELWRTDGTEAGTVLVSDIYPGTGNSAPRDFFFNNRRLYFSAEGETVGRELFSVMVN
jgi:ELWxxDGT repeat protein